MTDDTQSLGTGPTNPDPPPPPPTSLIDIINESSWRAERLVHDGTTKMLKFTDGEWSLSEEGDHQITFNDYIKLLNYVGGTIDRSKIRKDDKIAEISSEDRDGVLWAAITPC